MGYISKQCLMHDILANLLQSYRGRGKKLLTSSYNFQKLTPLNHCNLGVYAEALDFVFSNDDLRNIAITGPYSSGKTSIFNSYMEQHKKRKKLNISLAYFDKGEIHESTTNKEKINTNDLAGKILNHLAHQLDPEKIPLSGFKILREASRVKIFINAVFWSLFFILLSIVLFVGNISEFAANWPDWFWLKPFFTDLTHHEIFPNLVLALICFIGVICLKIVALQSNGKLIKSFSFKGNTVNLFEDKEASYFDKYLDEILYLLKKSDVEIIVFEDMDRYDNNLIFSKLREINFLANIKTSKTIRFFYLLKDDMFIVKDRTKFFDFIIPIVPIIDGSNSYAQLQKIMNDGGMPFESYKCLLQDISLYIDDMRILKNIYNEFRIYQTQIASTEQDLNKLFAMIVYKNLFPKDFSDLHLNSGYVFFMLSNRKNSFIQELKQDLECKILENKNRLEEYEKEHLNNLDELEALYMPTLSNPINHPGRDGEAIVTKQPDQFKSYFDYYRTLKTNLSLQNNIRYQQNFQAKFDQLSSNSTFVARKVLLEQKFENFSLLHQRNVDLQKRIVHLETKSFTELAIDEDYNNILFLLDLESKEVKNFEPFLSDPYFPLIKFLLSNGYIDESYPDYMNYFYPYTVSENDKIFLRSITDRNSKEFSYKLNNPELVLSHLEDYKFDQEQILNFDLLVYLLETNHPKRVIFINNLINHKRYDFISSFMEYAMAEICDILLQTLNEQWPGIIHNWLSPDSFVDHKGDFRIKDYIISTCYSTPIEIISKMNIEQCLTTYISNESDFLAIENPNTDKLISTLEALEVKFVAINPTNANKELFEQIYQKNLYFINSAMIFLLLKTFYEIPFSIDYTTKNYSLISSQPEQPLKIYIDLNIEKYISEILNIIGDKKIEDDINAVQTLMNNEQISHENKLAYIKRLATIMPSLDEIHDSLWEPLIQNGNIAFSPDNVLLYFYEHAGDYDNTLVEFINSASFEFGLNKDKILEYCNDTNALIKFYSDTIKCQNINDDKWSQILEDANTHFDDLHNTFSSVEFDASKIQILIQKGIISMTSKNLSFIRAEHSNCLQNFVAHNIVDYLEILETDPSAKIQSELVETLSWNIDDESKRNIIALAQESISIKQTTFPDEIFECVLKLKFDPKELDQAIMRYDNASKKLKITIEDICQKYIEHIINANYDLPYDLLTMLLKSNSLEKITKIWLFANQLKRLNAKKFKQTQFLALISHLDMPELQEVFDGKRPKMKVTDFNAIILEFCRNAGWLNFQLDKDDEQYYRLYSRKNVEKQTLIDK